MSVDFVVLSRLYDVCEFMFCDVVLLLMFRYFDSCYGEYLLFCSFGTLFYFVLLRGLSIDFLFFE